ncbi:MAG: two-component sensor histidine kinase [Deltaproteobacteria bacterium]|nr:MAG: two-component sensor histidine kinase [Deltaproteobacteria bacterium]
MKNIFMSTERNLEQKLKLLMFFRLIFTSILLGSTIVLQLNESVSPLAPPLLFLYGLIASIFVMSFFYSVTISSIQHKVVFAYIQIGIDTLVVTLIVLVTGCFLSFFSFLYLVVIIYSSVLLFLNGSMVMAGLCSLQYVILISLEYYGIIQPYGADISPLILEFGWLRVLYKVMITAVACYAVAFLSGFLSEQTRRSRNELQRMSEHVKRMEKMASLGEMAAGLAHEIKNPLASLSGSIQVLREENRHGPEHDNLMRIVLRETDRLTSLASDFLLFAKPPAGKRESIRLDEAINEILELFQKNRTIREKLTIERNLIHDIFVDVDPIHLRQILWNLLLNAAEAIDGEGRIAVDMVHQKNRRIQIVLTDNGEGISPENVDAIFDPFYTTKHSGTGLGLSIVYRILEYYGSRLDVDSTEGQGTLVHFSLKILTVPEPLRFGRGLDT